jgi:hypothetical protein
MSIPLNPDDMKNKTIQTIVEILRFIAALLAGYVGATL